MVLIIGVQIPTEEPYGKLTLEARGHPANMSVVKAMRIVFSVFRQEIIYNSFYLVYNKNRIQHFAMKFREAIDSIFANWKPQIAYQFQEVAL